MRKIAISFGLLIMILSLVPAAVSLAAPAAKSVVAVPIAPALSKAIVSTIPLNLANGVKGVCNIMADGSQVCYSESDPQYTDPSYSCPQGYTPVAGDPSHCQKTVDDSGYVYADRPIVPAEMGCPEHWTLTSDKTQCQKVDVAGHYDFAPQPVITPESWTCPGPITWTYSYQGHTYSITFSYDKKDNDPHKCHRPSDNNTPPSSWPGYVRGKFNQDNPEFKDANHHDAVYGDCSTLGTGWQSDPAHSHQCRKWIDTTYKYTALITIEPAHPGDCPEDYDPTPGSDTQCRKWVEGSHIETINANVTAGTPYCAKGSTMNADGTKCLTEVPCPPPPPIVCGPGTVFDPNTKTCVTPPPPSKGGMNCKQYYEALSYSGHLDRYYNIPACNKPPKTGGSSPFENTMSFLQSQTWWPWR